MMLSPQLREDFYRDGFVRVPDVFDADDLARFNKAFALLRDRRQKVLSITEMPEMENWWSDGRLLEIATELLGGPVVYFFSGHLVHYDIALGKPIAARHVHHDGKGTSRNLLNRLNTALDLSYPVVRFAVYLQDTESQSGGLKVIPGSHRMNLDGIDVRDLDSYNVRSRPGDLVAFSHRLLHSPFAMRLKDDPDWALKITEENILSAYQPDLFLPVPETRDTIFIDYAAVHELADFFIKNRAVLSSNPSSRLAEHLVEGGFLEAHAEDATLFRVDQAIAETAFAIDACKKHDLPEAATRHLKRLPKLCQAHWECSPYHTLFDGEIPDTSMDTAMQLYDNIRKHIKLLNAQVKDHMTDPTMNELRPETWLRLP